MNRRELFHLGAGTALAAFQSKAASSSSSEEDFWSGIRNEFTTDRTVVNLNNGYASPAPRTVQEALRRYTDYSNMGPYHTMIRELEPKVEMARRMIADFAGCDSEEIAITRNSSESLEIAQMGIDLKPGDEVLTTNQDYPRMLTTFRQRERRDGIKLKTISFPVPVVSMDDLYQRFEQAITPRTKVILVCHITNRTGQIFPIKRICDMAHARGITVIVDGAHAFNQFPFKISDLNCDYYGVSLHKWTFAPIGTGFLYVRKSKIKETWPLMAANNTQDTDIRKFEEIGTHPAAIHDAICEAMVFNQNLGIERKSARLRYLRDRWADQIAKSPKVKILHNPAPEMSCGIGMFGVVGADASKLVQTLQNKYGIFTAYVPHEEYIGIRVTASVYTTTREVDYFADAVVRELA
jgi:selenocysteine lyase/cysteine desulfurase